MNVTLPPPSRHSGPLERMPHLMRRVIELWQTRELSPFVDSLLLDSRDGQRAGLPPEVADELMLLSDVNRVARAMRMADREAIAYGEALRALAIEDASAKRTAHGEYDDPLVSHDTMRTKEQAARPRVAAPARNEQGAWGTLFRLLGNKWFLIVIVAAIAARAKWDTLGPAIKALWQAFR